jgi:hypothetical protein
MTRDVVLYKCDKCGMQYQLSSGVEVVNKFAWSKWVREMVRQCIGCRKGGDKSKSFHSKSDPQVYT